MSHLRTPTTTTVLRLALLPALLAAASLAAQAQSSPWYLGVSQGITHDTNLYRIGGGQALTAGLAKSDTVYTTTLFGGLNQPIGRQRVYGQASLRANKYQSNDHLDNNGYALNLGLDWSTVERLQGNVFVSANQSLVQFSDGNGLSLGNRRNVSRSEQLGGTVRLGVVTRFTIEGGLNYRRQSYSAPEWDRQEFNETSGSLGLRWRPSDLLSAGVALRLTRAHYPRFTQLAGGAFDDDTLKREDIDFTAQWQPSGNSNLSARLSPTRTRYSKLAGANFSGLTGSLNWAWQPTGKLRINTTLSRDTGQSASATNLGVLGVGSTDYSRTTNALRIAGDWEATSKVSVNASLRYGDRALRNNISFNSTTLPQEGSDRTTLLSLGARWSPTRAIQLGCDLSHENRSASGGLTNPYDADTFGCYGQFTLQ